MKELFLYLALTTALWLLLPLLTAPPPTLTLPHLATRHSLLLLHGDLPLAHPSLPLYQRIYLLSDQATAELPNRTVTRFFNQREQMTGIIYTYDSFELAPEVMSAGFMDISNLQRFMNKVVMVPLGKEECLGQWEQRSNGNSICSFKVTVGYLIESARVQSEKRLLEEKQFEGENTDELGSVEGGGETSQVEGENLNEQEGKYMEGEQKQQLEGEQQEARGRVEDGGFEDVQELSWSRKEILPEVEEDKNSWMLLGSQTGSSQNRYQKQERSSRVADIPIEEGFVDTEKPILETIIANQSQYSEQLDPAQTGESIPDLSLPTGEVVFQQQQLQSIVEVIEPLSPAEIQNVIVQEALPTDGMNPDSEQGTNQVWSSEKESQKIEVEEQPGVQLPMEEEIPVQAASQGVKYGQDINYHEMAEKTQTEIEAAVREEDDRPTTEEDPIDLPEEGIDSDEAEVLPTDEAAQQQESETASDKLQRARIITNEEQSELRLAGQQLPADPTESSTTEEQLVQSVEQSSSVNQLPVRQQQISQIPSTLAQTAAELSGSNEQEAAELKEVQPDKGSFSVPNDYQEQQKPEAAQQSIPEKHQGSSQQQQLPQFQPQRVEPSLDLDKELEEINQQIKLDQFRKEREETAWTIPRVTTYSNHHVVELPTKIQMKEKTIEGTTEETIEDQQEQQITEDKQQDEITGDQEETISESRLDIEQTGQEAQGATEEEQQQEVIAEDLQEWVTDSDGVEAEEGDVTPEDELSSPSELVPNPQLVNEQL